MDNESVGKMYKVSLIYFFKTDKEFAEIERVVWGDPDNDYAGGLSEIACGGHDAEDNERCHLDVGFGSVVCSEELTEKYLDCRCKCCSH